DALAPAPTRTSAVSVAEANAALNVVSNVAMMCAMISRLPSLNSPPAPQSLTGNGPTHTLAAMGETAHQRWNYRQLLIDYLGPCATSAAACIILGMAVAAHREYARLHAIAWSS